MKLTLRSVDAGFCRIYYRNEAGDLYCFQSTFRGQFALYSCTLDGEPSHVLGLAARTLDKLPEAACEITKAFSAWVADKEALCLSQ